LPPHNDTIYLSVALLAKHLGKQILHVVKKLAIARVNFQAQRYTMQTFGLPLGLAC